MNDANQRGCFPPNFNLNFSRFPCCGVFRWPLFLFFGFFVVVLRSDPSPSGQQRENNNHSFMFLFLFLFLFFWFLLRLLRSEKKETECNEIKEMICAADAMLETCD